MTLDDIMKAVDEAYGEDGMILQYYEDFEGEHGDTLAKFIVAELRETYDEDAEDQEKLDEAYRVMETALDQLYNILAAIDDLGD
jgi:hypothetical protein